jgi:phage terminase Nu1 subunit (DNA packaging protein)
MRERLELADRFAAQSTDGGVIVAPEAYVDRKQLAELMGVSVATIDRMVRAGMPSETWGIRSRRFLASQALAWARTRRAAQ